MDMQLLKTLCETPGVPGREDRIRAVIRAEIEGLADEITVDAMGSLIAKRNGTGKRVMMLCHMDEIGFLVSHVSDEGWIYVSPVGGFDTRNLFSRRVKICTPKGDLKGVMNPGGKPVHIASPEDRKKVPEVSEFFVDIGMGKDAKDHVQIGDYIVMDEPFMEIGTKVVSKALDNRIACWLGIEALRAAKESGHDCELHVAFTVQEEVGLRGAKTASHAVQPDIGFGIDTTLACDTPGVPKPEAVTTQGLGFGMHIKDGSFIADIGMVEEIEAIARDNSIPFQRTILAAGGQDGAAVQQAASGARTVGIVVGTRYIHTVTEMIDKTDLQAARDILAAWIAKN